MNRLLAALIALGLLAVDHPCSAMDSKYYNAAGCQPYSNLTSASDLSFRAHGLKNISTEAEYVVCGVATDTSPLTWVDASSGADLVVSVRGLANGFVACEVYIGSNLVGQPVTYSSGNVSIDGNAQAYPVPTGLLLSNGLVYDGGGLPSPPVTLFCRIPPGASILGYRLRERSTDT